MSRQVFRSPTAVVVWWIWVLFAVANLIDLAVQGRDRSSLVAAFVILVVTGAMWAAAQRPRVIADDAGLRIVNPLREHQIGWPAVVAIDTTDLLRVRCEWPEGSPGQPGRKTIYAWAVGSSRRRQAVARMREQRRARSRRGPLTLGARYGGFDAPGTPASRAGASRAGAARGGPEPGDAETIVTALTERADRARTDAPDAPAVAPVSTWYWPAAAAIGACVLALLIAVAV